MRRISLLAALMGLAVATPLFAQITAAPLSSAPLNASAGSESQLVRDWYRDYLGREPGPELAAWVHLLRGGMSAIDVQATILGSDESFNQQGRDPQTFILETLQSVTWQAPSSTLIRQWNDRLTQLRGDRFALAREILQNYNQTQPTANQASEVAERLVAASRLLQDTGNFELSGTIQGQQLSLRAKSLYDACTILRSRVAIRNYRLDDALRAARDVETAYNAVQNTLNNPPGTAPSSAAIVRRIDSMLNELQVAFQPQSRPGTGPIVPTPTTPPASNIGYDPVKLLTQIDGVSRGTQSVVQLFAQANASYTYGILLRDLNSFASQVDAFKLTARQESSLQKLQWEYQALRDQAARLGPQLLDNRPPVFTRLYWTSVESGLEQIGDTLKMPTSATPGPSLPPATTPNAELIAFCDQAVSHTDAFLAGISPYVVTIPTIPRLQRDMRTLRSQILQLRQSLVQNASPLQINQQIAVARAQYSPTYDLWSEIVEGYKLTSYTKLSPVGRSLTAIEEALAAPGSGSNVYLRPGVSRLSQLTTALDTELASYQGALRAFQNYNEYRALSEFSQQLAAYSKSLVELDVDRVRNLPDQQKLVAAMQRVNELLEAYTKRMEQRAIATRDPNATARATDVRRSLDRLTALVNDIERDVH